MSFSLGLTGSIGMGKSTTAALFAEAGCAVWDADAAVHRLYDRGGAAVEPIGAAFPQATMSGSVDRTVLKELISNDDAVLKTIEEIVHPLVQADRKSFRAESREDILIFDIPLLFETGAEVEMDAVACVHVPPEIQRERVLARGTMTTDQFEQILAKQMPIADKLARSDYRIETDTLDHARAQVTQVIEDIRRRMPHA
ncbi:dephospho-CoA kinase [Tritonibacter mobilis]|uniref:dephospho-CoA kinase n=1 Tax=Tritonibacter mobilis TaxID=379347 RepID=UPI000806ABFC|nr:dephospho-CoA kinase [Tritonibacter mobilis]GLP87155.1 dephospho-CoA kinase [Tritonibacter mobilis]SDW46635.1 dephospho-CoA kinase [Tritonibacter mobilis]